MGLLGLVIRSFGLVRGCGYGSIQLEVGFRLSCGRVLDPCLMRLLWFVGLGLVFSEVLMEVVKLLLYSYYSKSPKTQPSPSPAPTQPQNTPANSPPQPQQHPPPSP